MKLLDNSMNSLNSSSELSVKDKADISGSSMQTNNSLLSNRNDSEILDTSQESDVTSTNLKTDKLLDNEEDVFKEIPRITKTDLKTDRDFSSENGIDPQDLIVIDSIGSDENLMSDPLLGTEDFITIKPLDVTPQDDVLSEDIKKYDSCTDTEETKVDQRQQDGKTSEEIKKGNTYIDSEETKADQRKQDGIISEEIKKDNVYIDSGEIKNQRGQDDTSSEEIKKDNLCIEPEETKVDLLDKKKDCKFSEFKVPDQNVEDLKNVKRTDLDKSVSKDLSLSVADISAEKVPDRKSSVQNDSKEEFKVPTISHKEKHFSDNSDCEDVLILDMGGLDTSSQSQNDSNLSDYLNDSSQNDSQEQNICEEKKPLSPVEYVISKIQSKIKEESKTELPESFEVCNDILVVDENEYCSALPTDSVITNEKEPCSPDSEIEIIYEKTNQEVKNPLQIECNDSNNNKECPNKETRICRIETSTQKIEEAEKEQLEEPKIRSLEIKKSTVRARESYEDEDGPPAKKLKSLLELNIEEPSVSHFEETEEHVVPSSSARKVKTSDEDENLIMTVSNSRKNDSDVEKPQERVAVLDQSNITITLQVPRPEFEYISNDPQENADNFDPKWDILRVIDNDAERYKAIRNRWRNLSIPNPNTNLTYRHHTKKPNSSETTADNAQPSASTSGCVNRSATLGTNRRRRFCTAFYENKISELDEKYEKEIKRITDQHQVEVFRLCQRQNMEQQGAIFLDTSNPFGGNFNLRNTLNRHKQDLECLLQNQKANIEDLQKKRNNDIGAYRKYVEEVRAFHSFYQGMTEQDDMFLTPEQQEHFAETERMYSEFNKFYN